MVSVERARHNAPVSGTDDGLRIVQRALGGPDVLSAERAPRPVPGPGEIVVRTLAAAVNYSDLQIRRGDWPIRRPDPWPYVPGLEVVGEVTAIGIGLHRHRDNSAAFLMLDGEGWMVIGDWADTGRRARCFEVRLLRSGSLALLKGGNLHGLANPGAGRAALFMFGGYD
jgi:hypothetical protein